VDAGTEGAEDLELRRAVERARFKYAAGCLHASKETGLPAHERGTYLAEWRKARDEAAGVDGPTPLCTMNHREVGCVEPSVSIGSAEQVFPSDSTGASLPDLYRNALAAVDAVALRLDDGDWVGLSCEALAQSLERRLTANAPSPAPEGAVVLPLRRPTVPRARGRGRRRPTPAR
jgi:hypothetical protein